MAFWKRKSETAVPEPSEELVKVIRRVDELHPSWDAETLPKNGPVDLPGTRIWWKSCDGVQLIYVGRIFPILPPGMAQHIK